MQKALNACVVSLPCRPSLFLCLHLYNHLTVLSQPLQVTAIWGWCLVSAANLMLGLSMAEIVSAYPTTGGVYFW